MHQHTARHRTHYAQPLTSNARLAQPRVNATQVEGVVGKHALDEARVDATQVKGVAGKRVVDEARAGAALVGGRRWRWLCR